MELKKRKKGKDYTIDQMMHLINYKFINGTSEESYVISNTAYKEPHKRIIICDAKYEAYEGDGDLMYNYYGSTILEAVTACFADRENHPIYAVDAVLF
jgi:hypothetical protein